MLGPVILNLTGPDGWLAFAVPTAIVLLAGCRSGSGGGAPPI